MVFIFQHAVRANADRLELEASLLKVQTTDGHELFHAGSDILSHVVPGSAVGQRLGQGNVVHQYVDKGSLRGPWRTRDVRVERGLGQSRGRLLHDDGDNSSSFFRDDKSSFGRMCLHPRP